MQATPPTMSPLRGWEGIALLPAAVIVFAPHEWPRWAFMWLLSFAIFVGCKWLTWRRTPIPHLPLWKHAGYLLAWPGLDAPGFLGRGDIPENERPTLREWGVAAARLLLGIFLFWWGARWVTLQSFPNNPDIDILAGWVGMVGLILMLHFGSFGLLSCLWRSLGVNAPPLMNRPLASTSVSEFWGRRWNTAFRDLTHRFLFRPLTAALGPRWAILAGFAFSGIVHDLVISIPAGGGYGWPTLFFGVQAAGMFVERSPVGKSIGLGKGWRGWLFAILILALPAYGLFHPPFIRTIILPFMHDLGAFR